MSKKILVVKLGALGDILQHSGQIRAIRLAHPNDHVTVITDPKFQSIFSRCPWIDEIMIDPRKPRLNLWAFFQLMRKINAQNFDCVYDLQGNERTRMYQRFTRAKWHYRWKEVVKALEASGYSVRHPVLPNLDWMVEDATPILNSAHIAPGYIFLIPGCSAQHPVKRWPHYVELARELMVKGYTPVIAPGPDEMEMSRSFPCPVLTQNGKPFSINLFAGLLKQARFVIGNDTGPTHMAAYLGVPGLALFGSYVSAQSTGLDKFLDIIEVKSLPDLSVERVLSRVSDLLS